MKKISVMRSCHDRDMTAHVEDAISSLRVVLAADESVRTGEVVTL